MAFHYCQYKRKAALRLARGWRSDHLMRRLSFPLRLLRDSTSTESALGVDASHALLDASHGNLRHVCARESVRVLRVCTVVSAHHRFRWIRIPDAHHQLDRQLRADRSAHHERIDSAAQRRYLERYLRFWKLDSFRWLDSIVRLRSARTALVRSGPARLAGQPVSVEHGVGFDSLVLLRAALRFHSIDSAVRHVPRRKSLAPVRSLQQEAHGAVESVVD